MRLVDNLDSTDPRFNLALEEYVLRHAPDADDYLMFYVNRPSIIVGRNQNTIEEIDAELVAERDIQVVRRISGGGAVYHDLGNLNFSFHVPYDRTRFNRYEHFTRPIVEVLASLGVPAELGGRNDILAGGRKISGNAQFVSPPRMLSHGTLLFDSDLDAVGAALRPKPGKVESKGVKSVRSRVANISEFLASPLALVELRDAILVRLFGTADRSRIPTVPLTDDDRAKVHELSARKYRTWDWNFGENPPSNVQRAKRFPAGELDVRIDVQGGRIAGLRIFGDFMGRSDVAHLEGRLVGLPYDRRAMQDALDGVALGEYFDGIPDEDVMLLLAP